MKHLHPLPKNCFWPPCLEVYDLWIKEGCTRSEALRLYYFGTKELKDETSAR